jgi:hypothetical protein
MTSAICFLLGVFGAGAVIVAMLAFLWAAVRRIFFGKRTGWFG